MVIAPEMDLVVKNTFIEFVEKRPNLRLARSRTVSDTALVVDVCPDTEISHALAWESAREFCKHHASSCDSSSESSTTAPSLSEALDVLPNCSDADVGAPLYGDSSTQAAIDECSVQETSLDIFCSPVMMPTYEYLAVEPASLPVEGGLFYIGGFEQGGFESTWCLPEGVGIAPCNIFMADSTSMQMPSVEGLNDMYMNPEDHHREAEVDYAKEAQQQHFSNLLANAFKTSQDEDSRTTVMLRDLPIDYTRGMLLELLNAEGFAGRYDFAYLPVNFSTSIGLGYAFVNLLKPSDAVNLMEHFDGFSRWVTASDKVCSVSWSYPHQGLEQHIERYRNSPVMHSSIPVEWKPILLIGDLEVPFPQPTKQIKAPKLRIRPETAQAAQAGGAVAFRV